MKRFRSVRHRFAVAFHVAESRGWQSELRRHFTRFQFKTDDYLSRQKFTILRFLVLQVAIFHIFVFLSLNLVSIESPHNLNTVLMILLPFLFTTIIISVWGFQITIRAIVPYYENLRLLQKFACFQLVVIFCKFQPLILMFVFQKLILECTGPFTVIIKIRSESQFPFTHATKFSLFLAIMQTIIQVEMFLLSCWAHMLYANWFYRVH